MEAIAVAIPPVQAHVDERLVAVADRANVDTLRHHENFGGRNRTANSLEELLHFGKIGLDSIATASLALGATIEMVATAERVISQWRLTAGTDAENEAGGIVRPDDYAPTANEKLWVRIM